MRHNLGHSSTDCLSANRLLAAQFISSILVTHYPKNCAAFPNCHFLHSCLFFCLYACFFVCLFVWTVGKRFYKWVLTACLLTGYWLHNLSLVC